MLSQDSMCVVVSKEREDINTTMSCCPIKNKKWHQNGLAEENNLSYFSFNDVLEAWIC